MDFRRPQRTAVIASAIVSVICLGLLSRSWTPQTTPLDVQVSRESARPREAYVSFISSTKKKGYVDSLRLLLWSLKYDPLTRDPYNRDFIVLTTNYTSPDVVAQLQAEGAITRDTPLILGMPNLYSSGFGEDHNYRDVYTKLAVWNMTDYDRVFFLDADILIIKQIHLLWDHPNADPPSGLAALSDAKWGQNHPIPLPDHPYFNCGTMILRPVEGRLEELLAVQDYDLALPEQNLLNKYFDRSGPYPWAPLDHMYFNVASTKADLKAGVHALHDKLWLHETGGGYSLSFDQELTELWKDKYGQMEGWWLAQHEFAAK